MKFSDEQIRGVSTKLQLLPELKEEQNQKYNGFEAIKLLLEDIISLRDRGYTFRIISTILCENGLKITENSLKNYFNLAKRGAKS